VAVTLKAQYWVRFPGDATQALLAQCVTQMSQRLNSPGPFDWTGYAVAVVNDAVVDAKYFRLYTGDAANQNEYRWYIKGSRNGHNYPLPAVMVGDLASTYQTALPSGTYVPTPSMWVVLFDFWNTKYLPAIQDFLVNHCGSTVLATSTTGAVVESAGYIQHQGDTFTVSNTNLPVLVSQFLTVVKNNLPAIIINTAGAVANRLQGIIQTAGVTAQAASQITALELLSQLVTAVQTLAQQDVDISLNYGSTVYSVRSKQVTQQ
jgi:hypothetical protein